VPDVSAVPSLSSVKPEYAALGELAAVLDNSGVGDRPFPAFSTIKCCGKKRGGEGDEVRFVTRSGKWIFGGEDNRCICGLAGGLEPSQTDARVGNSDAKVTGGESLRFLWEDVVKVKALFPKGNKAWCMGG